MPLMHHALLSFATMAGPLRPLFQGQGSARGGVRFARRSQGGGGGGAQENTRGWPDPCQENSRPLTSRFGGKLGLGGVNAAPFGDV